jgi:hypothetical protein
MKNEDALAEFILKEAEIKESLRKRIQESAFEYYTERYRFATIGGLLVMSTLAYLFITRAFPIWGLVALAMSGTALMESKRNSGRIDAMVRLSNLQESEACTADTTSTAAEHSKKQLHH